MTKDPDSTLDYGFNWAGWLRSDETVVSSAWAVVSDDDDALTIGEDEYASTNSGTVTKVWLSGGTLNATYRITNHIVTSSDPPRIEDRSFTLKIKDR